VGCYAANYQVFGDNYASSTPPYLPPAPTGNFPSRIATITDGTSNTIGVVEKTADCTDWGGTYGGTIWSAIANYEGWIPHFADASVGQVASGSYLFQTRPLPSTCDPNVPSSPWSGMILVGMMDGSVRPVSASISPTTWWAAVSPNGGEVLGTDW
jgi:hypothetical protein